jgi:hypothetical protein
MRTPSAPEPRPAAAPTKRPRSAAQRAASRANGARSGGPVSEAGKRRSRVNGVRHGLRVEAMALLPQLDREGFEAWRDAVQDGAGPLLEAERDQLAGVLWLRTRATAHEMALLASLDAKIRAGAFLGAPGAADAALEGEADRQLQRLLRYARYGTRIRRELDRLQPLLAPEAKPARPAAHPARHPGAGSPPAPESSPIKTFSGSLGKIEPPPPLPTDPEEGRPLRRLTLDALGHESTETFLLEQLQQQERLGQPPPDLLVETDLTLAFWGSDGVALPRVQRWRDQLAGRLTTARAATSPAEPPSRPEGEGIALSSKESPSPQPSPILRTGEGARGGFRPPLPSQMGEGRGEGAASAPIRSAPTAPALTEAPPPALPEHETLEQQVLRLFGDPQPRQPGDLALADSLVANLCYRRKEAYGGIRLFDLLDVLDRLRQQGRIAHPDIVNHLGSKPFATAHAARFGKA